ncbi:MAG: DUF1569 domain-containing protein [Planctomycetota bacterium]
MPKIRRVDLDTLDDVIKDIQSLRDRGYSQGGKWNLSQLCEHLTGTMRIGLDGTMKPLPYLARATLGNFVFWLFTRRVSRGIAGIKTMPELEPVDRDDDDQEVISVCLATLQEARDRTEPIPPYALTTSATLDQWRQMMIVHAQHHLEFLKPVDSNESVG